MRKSIRITNCLLSWFLLGLLPVVCAAPRKKMEKQFLNLGSQKPPGYTHVVVSAPGKMVFVSGRGGAAADGSMPSDFETQAVNTFEDLKKCLSLSGAGFKDVV